MTHAASELLRRAGSREAGWNLERVEPCEYVNEGDVVVVNVGRTDGKAVVATVVCAAGYHARVANEKIGFDQWVNVADCARRKGNG